MRRHQGHIRQRSEGSFELRYSCGIDAICRKWKVKPLLLRGPRKDAEKALRRILNTIETNEYIEPIQNNCSRFSETDGLKRYAPR